MAITPQNYWPLGSTVQKADSLSSTSEYRHFGFMSVNPVDGKMVVVYRRHTTYSTGTGSIYFRISSNGGTTWGSETLVLSETNIDLRNLAGGYTSTGRLLIFYGRYQNQSVWLSISYIYSDDNGDTWSSPQSFYSQSGSAYSPYGHVVDLGQGQLFQTWYEVNGSTYSLKFSKSYHDGDVFQSTVTIYSGTLLFTEPSMVNLGGGCLLVLSRINGGSCFAQFRSIDYGANWTGPEYTTFETWSNGQNMPWLSYINYQGVGIIACYYMRRDSSPYLMKVVYGLANNIINNGVSGWNQNTVREVIPSSLGNRSGYQSFFHPLNQFKGIGIFFNCSSILSYPVVIFTPIGGMIDDVLATLMP